MSLVSSNVAPDVAGVLMELTTVPTLSKWKAHQEQSSVTSDKRKLNSCLSLVVIYFLSTYLLLYVHTYLLYSINYLLTYLSIYKKVQNEYIRYHKLIMLRAIHLFEEKCSVNISFR